jgi:hypothetical protein
MHNQLDSKDSCKAKTLKGGGVHQRLPFLKKKRKLVFMSYMNVDPQMLLTWLLLLDVLTKPRTECNAYI